ncbi:DUF5681 domain-containing protein [Pedobacter sp. MC2016-05]|uniref:DUF5681 domain-containing protein n=1 Tax=Pedobacter sp. MC2016-05 TaxID=2994474 RepID=UPI00224685B8|nr:DUF5681 domain-containing protein [Pedobacter sp. MC2016-05]MCX2474077.1 DUF5681 domain-containing protein [Pedobacter sp. MC2016-05]
MARFKKGESGNPNGRAKGALNKRTKAEKEAYDTIMNLIEKRMTDGDDVINNLSPARAAELYVNLVNYKKYKLNASKNQNDTTLSGGLNVTVKYDDK